MEIEALRCTECGAVWLSETVRELSIKNAGCLGCDGPLQIVVVDEDGRVLDPPQGSSD